MSWGPDTSGVNGVYLGKDVIDCAGAAIEEAVTKITPKIMTWQQYREAGLNMAQRSLFGPESAPSYRPDFTKCVDHFAIHAGGYAVLKGIQEAMNLPAETMLPSFAGLKEYSLAYMETCGDVKKGDIVLQIGVGGGVKAGLADLPRGIDLGDIRDEKLKGEAEEATARMAAKLKPGEEPEPEPEAA
eukprot:gene32110-16627_t